MCPQATRSGGEAQFLSNCRNTGESTCDFVDRIKRAARNCEFRDQTLNMVRDKLVLNYPDQAVKQRMMGETDISLDNMVKLALMFESIQSNCRTIDNSYDINRIANPTHTMVRVKNQKCRNCGRSHESVCPAKGQVCRRCGKKNHFERVCRAKSEARKQLQQIKERTKKNHDLQHSTQHRILCPGSKVRFRIDNRWRKGKIKSNEGFRRYRVVTDDGQEFVRNRRFLFSNAKCRTMDSISLGESN